MARAAGVTDPCDINEADLAAWQESWRLAPESHCTYISHISAFYRWALERGLVDHDPSRVLVRPKLPRRVPRPMSEAHVEEALRGSTGRVRAYLHLAAYAGLRACEIATLRREDVRESADRPVLIVMGKGAKERIIPLAPQLLEELRRVGMPRSGFVFGRHNDPARATSPRTVSNSCNEYLHGLGFTETLHTLRHRFASRFYQISLDLRMTQDMLGHASPATTAMYAAFSAEEAARVIGKLSE